MTYRVETGPGWRVTRPSEANRRPNHDAPCPVCGERVVRYLRRAEREHPAFCSKRCASTFAQRERGHTKGRTGAANHQWKGDAISVRGGRGRALHLFPPGPCEVCGAPNGERHHRDGNTANNAPENIARLCRRHHMEADGRMAKVADMMRAIQPKGVAARWGTK